MNQLFVIRWVVPFSQDAIVANEGLVRDSSGFRILKMVHNPGGDDGILGIWDNPSYWSCLLETDRETSDAGNIYSFHGKHGGGRFPRSEQQGSLEMLKPWMCIYIYKCTDTSGSTSEYISRNTT